MVEHECNRLHGIGRVGWCKINLRHPSTRQPHQHHDLHTDVQRRRWKREYEYNHNGGAAAATHDDFERELNRGCVQRFQHAVVVKHRCSIMCREWRMERRQSNCRQPEFIRLDKHRDLHTGVYRREWQRDPVCGDYGRCCSGPDGYVHGESHNHCLQRGNDAHLVEHQCIVLHSFGKLVWRNYDIGDAEHWFAVCE